jgi:hypothetical protein
LRGNAKACLFYRLRQFLISIRNGPKNVNRLSHSWIVMAAGAVCFGREGAEFRPNHIYFLRVTGVLKEAAVLPLKNVNWKSHFSKESSFFEVS